MTVGDVPEKARAAVVYAIPPVLGFTIDISAGMLMTILTCMAAFIGQLVYQIGSNKARSHKDWVEAENARVQPQLDRAREERDDLKARMSRLEIQLGDAIEAERDAIEAERDLALLMLEKRGFLRPREARS